uniref:RING-type E3 ubiquitin transferase n=1 Tax=Kalanchoe fedtschenkoi TaxID=63787 RepID=A0A7N0UZ48_KALFE
MSASSTSSQTIVIFDELVREFYSRKLLLQPPVYQSSTTSPPPVSSSSQNRHTAGEPYGENGFDANVVMVLSVLLCALVCSLGLNSIVRCVLRCSHLVATQSASTARLANTGMKKKAIKTIPTLNYSDGLNLQHLDTECVICLSEFAEGERVRVLPKCNHGFHVRCIDKWLNSHSSCPTCRYSVMETCQKKISCSQSSSPGIVQPSQTPTPVPSLVPQEPLCITPLQPEPMVPSYR